MLFLASSRLKHAILIYHIHRLETLAESHQRRVASLLKAGTTTTYLALNPVYAQI